MDIKCCEFNSRDRIHNASFSSNLMNGLNKVECYITIDWKAETGTNTLVVLPICNLRGNSTPGILPQSQHPE
jgi:hypothetical protein